MYEIRKHKIELRQKYLARREMLSPAVRAGRDAQICRNLLSSAVYRYSDVLLLYYPTGTEVDILPVARAAAKAGKRVAYPRCNTEDHSMTFYFIRSEKDMEEGSYGLREPREGLPVFLPEEKGTNVLCVVPAVVYDRKGYRIGYGGGYYDRFFGKFRPNSVGVVYEEFLLGSVPHGRFDMSVDVVMTERGVYAGK